MSRTSDQLPPPPPHLARWSTSLLFFLNGTIFATWATRIPAVQAKLMLSTGELGIALLGTAFGALAAMNLSGYLAARFGSRSVHSHPHCRSWWEPSSSLGRVAGRWMSR